jgi:hypothetical protein
MLDHYGLLSPIEAAELRRFMWQTRFHGDGADLALGTDYAIESHGGGLLRVLFDHWRPEGRAPRLSDEFLFESNGRTLVLARLLEAYQQQIFLPVPGVAPEAAGARLPETPQLPRMWLRFGLPGGPVRDVELDAYKFLSLLIELEPDASRGWQNRFGQPLSVALLMQHVRDFYLASAAPSADPPDHSNLHLVELLAAFGGDLRPVQQHFVTHELAQRRFEAADENFLLTHFADSLGELLDAVPSWSAAEQEAVKHWLVELDQGRFRDIGTLDLESLCHLAKGLRSVSAHQSALE